MIRASSSLLPKVSARRCPFTRRWTRTSLLYHWGLGQGPKSIIVYSTIVVYFDILWYSILWYGILWHSMVYYGILWYKLESLEAAHEQHLKASLRSSPFNNKRYWSICKFVVLLCGVFFIMGCIRARPELTTFVASKGAAGGRHP